MSDALTEGLTAGVASAISKFSVYPFDLLKTRCAVSNSSLVDVSTTIYKKQGIQGFYQGARPKIFKSVIGKIFYFYIYKSLSDYVKSRGNSKSLTAKQNIIVGFLSEVFELPIIMPLEAVATRAQLSKDQSVFSIVQQLIDEGRLFVSLDAYVLGAFQPAIQNTIFDQIKLKIKRELSAFESFILGVLASSIAISITYPLDFARTLNQAGKKKVINIVIGGAPDLGSGKGTQASFISEKFGLVHLSTDDILRNAVKAGTPIGLAAKELMESGKLVPDEIVIECIKERILQNDVKEKGFLLDGFPRTPEQANELLKIAKVSLFLELDVPDEILLERIIGRRTDPVTNQIYHVKSNPAPTLEIEQRLVIRADDRPEMLKVRLEGYHQHAKPVRNKFLNCLHTINGYRNSKEIREEIENIIRATVQSKTGLLDVWVETIQTHGIFHIFSGLSANLSQGVLSAALMLMLKEKIAITVAQWVNFVRNKF